MALTALILAILALLLALSGRSQVTLLSERIARLESSSGGSSSSSSLPQSDGAEELNRKFIACLAAGQMLDPAQVREGRLWGDLTGVRALELVDGGARILDVRTPQETAAGMIPGALQIPVNELEQRFSELDPAGPPMLIYCAAGVRSAAACEFLSNQGYEGLYNLESGFPTWPGATERPT